MCLPIVVSPSTLIYYLLNIPRSYKRLAYSCVLSPTRGMDKLVLPRGASGLSFLNIAERERDIGLLNIGMIALSLGMDPNAVRFLLGLILNGNTSMKAVHEATLYYDKAL